jgi:hypothetical protein
VKGVKGNNPTSSDDGKEVSIGMLRHISVLLLSVLVLVALAASVALAAPPAGKGQPGATEQPKSTGSPTDPNCWGEVTTQVAGPTYGEHASSFPTPRLGVGNVARNDDGEGGRPSDHGAVVGPMVGASCEDGPETG